MNDRTETQVNDKKSLAMLVSAMFIYGSIGIFRRLIPVSSGLLAFTRGILGAAVLFLFVLIKRYRKRRLAGGSAAMAVPESAVITKKDYLHYFVIGAAIGINWMLLFEAYNYTTVAAATLCYYMEPTIVILLSPLIFREKLTARRLICAGAAVVGMVLVSGVLESGNASGDYRGVLFGLGAAALYASVVIMNKKVRPADPYLMTVVELVSAAAILIPYLLVTEDIGGIGLTTETVVLILIVGVVHTGISYALYFGSMNGLRAQTIALFSYIDPVTALILSAVILHEHMTVYGMIGAVLILGAAVISEQTGKQD